MNAKAVFLINYQKAVQRTAMVSNSTNPGLINAMPAATPFLPILDNLANFFTAFSNKENNSILQAYLKAFILCPELLNQKTPLS